MSRARQDDPNYRQRIFATLVARGTPATKAYIAAGYKKGGISNAYELLAHPPIAALIKEEQERMRTDASFVTREWMLDQLRKLDERKLRVETRMRLLGEITKLLGLAEAEKVELKVDAPLFIVQQKPEDKPAGEPHEKTEETPKHEENGA